MRSPAWPLAAVFAAAGAGVGAAGAGAGAADACGFAAGVGAAAGAGAAAFGAAAFGAALALHQRSLAMFGGASGLRDEGLVRSAVAQPRNDFYYGGAENPWTFGKEPSVWKTTKRKPKTGIGLALLVARK